MGAADRQRFDGGERRVERGALGAVGDDQHRRLGGVGVFVLAHPVDRDARPAEFGRHLGEGARGVGQQEAQVEGGLGAVAGAHRRRQGRGGLAEGGAAQPAGEVDQVGDDGRGGGAGAGARAAVDGLADEIALDHHHVGHALERAERRAGGHQAGLGAGLQALRRHPGDAEQLDAVAHVGGGADVGEADPLDPLDGDALEIDPGPEGERGEQRELLRRVDPAHVEGRVGLGVAEPLRLGQHRLVGRAGLLDLGQDVVAGAVHHPHHPGDGVAGEALGQGLDDGDAPGHRRLEGERDALGLGGLGEGLAVAGEQGLVGGDDAAPRGDGGLGHGLGRAVLAADHLDDEVDVVAPGERHRIVLPGVAGEIHAAVAVARAGGDGGDLDGTAGAGGDERTVGLEHADHPGAHGAETGDGDAQRFGHGKLPGLDDRAPGLAKPPAARKRQTAVGRGRVGE